MQTLDARRTQTRERLIDASIRLFRSQGVSASGVDQLCREAGVTKGVFAHHFPGGKHELVAAAITQDTADMTAMLERTYERTGGSVPKLVHGLFTNYGRLMAKYGWAFGCPVAAVAIESGTAPEDAALAGEAFASWRAHLASLDDKLDPSTATLVLAAFEGAILIARAERNPEIFDEVGTTLASLIERTSS